MGAEHSLLLAQQAITIQASTGVVSLAKDHPLPHSGSAAAILAEEHAAELLVMKDMLQDEGIEVPKCKLHPANLMRFAAAHGLSQVWPNYQITRPIHAIKVSQVQVSIANLWSFVHAATAVG